MFFYKFVILLYIYLFYLFLVNGASRGIFSCFGSYHFILEKHLRVSYAHLCVCGLWFLRVYDENVDGDALLIFDYSLRNR